MRDIVFRGKRVDNGEWVEGDLSQNYIHHKEWTIVVGGCVYHEVYKHTIGQYTGLNDKNGVKIFEGDIVEYKLNEKSDRIGYVVYKDCQFYVKDKLGEGYRLVDLDKGYSIEVVGNIHDNKDLIK